MDIPTAPDRLESWKEIAAYLKRDVRTVQRWEKLEGLPVHRHVHDERATAYAFSNEIDEWRDKRRAQAHDGATALDVPREDAGPFPPSGARGTRQAAAAIAVAAAVTGLAIWSLTRSRPDPTPLSSLSVVFAPSERFREWGPEMALSPDGATLVYGSSAPDGQLRIRRIDRLESHALEGASGFAPFFSPDGRWIGFYRINQLMKISVDGGTAIPLGATGFIGAGDWGVDDFIVYATITPQGTHGLYRVPASGGTPQLVAALDGKADDSYWLTPQSIAGGRVILCTLSRSVTSGSRFQVVAVSVATGERRVLVDDAKHGLYLGDGVLVFWRSRDCA